MLAFRRGPSRLAELPGLTIGYLPMNLHRSLFVAALAAAAGLSFAPVTPAQTAAPAGNALGGNPVPGVCMLSREAVFAQSKVGQAASERLKQLATQQQTLLEGQRKPLDTDIQAFQQKAGSLTEAQRQQQGQALQQRMQSYQAQVNQLGERIQLTRAKVVQQIGEQAQPVIASSYASHHCGLLLNRDAVLGGNTSNDLTADVVRGLDGRISTLSFNLEPAPAPASNGK
jgi:Skp family chaperone for outer membrane proteins